MALALAICLWHKAGWQRTTVVRLNLRDAGFDMDRQVARRALRALEGAGLVRVERHRNCCPVVTLLEARHESD
jgi:hypothetical protein